VESAIDDVEDPASARHPDGFALLKAVNRRDTRFVAWQAAEDVHDFPAKLFLPELPQAGKPGLKLTRFGTACHRPRVCELELKCKLLISFVLFRLYCILSDNH
jgi:hypothetical protein